MKILHVVQSLDPAWGGIARVLPQLAGGLAAAGDTCRIATLSEGRFGSAPDVPGVEVLRFTDAGNSALGSSSEFARRATSLAQDADVVHMHGLWTGLNWRIGAAARKVGRPYIMSPRSMLMPWAWKRSWWKKRPIGWLFEHGNLRRATFLHALSAGEAEAIRERGFNDHIEIIPNGLRAADYANLGSPDAMIARFPELAGNRWIVFLGRVHPQKGIIQAMQACFDVLTAGPQWHLVIAGPDEVGMTPALKAAVGRKGLTERVTFTGMLARPEVLSLLAGAKLFLQPSMSEGLSNSILEALAGGVPVVISPACNLPEVGDAGAGKIVESHRRDIAQALKALVTMDDAALAQMGAKGQALVRERFDWSSLIPRYQAMYRLAAG